MLVPVSPVEVKMSGVCVEIQFICILAVAARLHSRVYRKLKVSKKMCCEIRIISDKICSGLNTHHNVSSRRNEMLRIRTILTS